MMRWKKEMVCVLCVCAVFALGGCGNRNDQKSNPQSETITDRNGEIQSENGNNAGDNTLIPEDGVGGDVTDDGMENGGNAADPGNTAVPNGDNADGRTDGNADGTVNGVTDDSNVNDVTDNGTGVGGAAKDIVDGVGDAGKDIIDGVEDAGDALVGEAPEDTAR